MWMVLVWQIISNLPSSPDFPATRRSHYIYGTSIRRENFQSIKNSLNLPSILCVTCQLATVCCSVFCGRNLFLLMIYSYLVHHVSEI